MSSVYERITSALSALGKRRDRDSSANDGGGALPQGNGSRAAKRFRPWEQADLHRRLETYKPLTWFAKPESVGPVTCALRGWINEGCETLCCEYCDAKLVYPGQVPYDQRQAAADLFSPGLISKHSPNCPWRKTQCETALLAYVPANSNDELCNLFQTLQNKLLKVDVLPDLDMIAIQAIRDAAGPQYGPYDELVLGVSGGAAGAGAIVVPGTTPVRSVRPPAVQITELLNNNGEGGGAAPSAGDPASSTTIVVQPSKLTPQQKARLLALLGWDLDVLQPESASGSAAAPYTQSACYSLAHLGVKPKQQQSSASAGSSPAAGAATAASAGRCGDGSSASRYPMSSVVLKCQHCNCRMGLWNFAGVRPVPSGRLTPAGQPATSTLALLSPRAGGGSFGGAAAAGGSIGGADPLSVTIAGGQFGLHGIGATAAARPFGSPAAAAPFRFGAAATSEPVFGVAALDAEAQRKLAAASGAAPTTTATGNNASSFGGFGGAAAAAAAVAPTPSATRAVATDGAAAAAAAAAPASAATTPVATSVRERLFERFVGHKRKASMSQAGGSDPMAVDAANPSSSSQQPAAAAAPAAGFTAPESVKRPRLGSYGSGSFGLTSPLVAAGQGQGQQAQTPVARVSMFGGAAGGIGGALEGPLAPRELDPVCQHRSWCPWVYTGAGEERHKSGWQHMLSALAAQQQQQQQQAAAAAATAAEAAAAAASPLGAAEAAQQQQQAGGLGSAGKDARQLRDEAVAAIRAL